VGNSDVYQTVLPVATTLSSRRIPALDGLRGIALLAVMLHHLSDYIPANGPGGKITKMLLFAGWSGVDLFFVLSGFLITGILIDTKGARGYLKVFYARRILRILPLYYAVLTVIVVFASLRPGHWPNAVLPSPHDRIYYFFYLNNWWPLLRDSWHPNIIGHFWSLAVEEQFYLLWPLCVLLMSKRRILPVSAVGIVAALLVRLFLYLHFGPLRDIVENVFARMDSLLAGAFMAALVRLPETLRRAKPYVLTVASGCTAAILFINLGIHGFTYSEWYVVLVFSLLAAAFGGLVLYAFLTSEEHSLFQTVFRSKPLTTIGKYSYGMYVYHVPLIALASLFLTQPLDLRRNTLTSTLFIAGIIAITFVVAKLSFDLFELRFLRLKSKFTFGKDNQR
jgi:peptidoglycan/LPS O-acetylase OafA/YrhL